MLVMALLYALLAKLVLSYFSESGNVTLIWFSGGLALAVLLLRGIRLWPGVFAGAFAAGLLVDDNGWLSAFIAMGNTLEAVAAAWWLQHKSGFSADLNHPGHFFRLTLVAAAASLISATIGPVAIASAGFIAYERLPQVMLHWWMADTFGIVSTTPLLLVWRLRPHGWLQNRRWFETLIFVGLSVFASLVVFLDIFQDSLGKVARGYWMFAFMIWGAVRFGRHGALLVSFVATVTALLGAAHHTGFFASDYQDTGMLNFWFYMTVLSWTGTTLVLTLQNYRKVAEDLRASESRLRAIIDVAPLPYALNDSQHNITFLNPAFIKLFGYELEDVPTLDEWWFKALPDAQYRKRMRQAWQFELETSMRDERPFQPMQLNIRCKNGDLCTAMAGVVPLGESFIGISLLFLHDVTEQLNSSRALLESNQLLHTILETLPIRVFWKDRDSRYLGCNTLFARDAGKHSVAEIKGRRDDELGWHVRAEAYRVDDLHVIASGESRLGAEECYVTPGGNTIWLRSSILPLRDAGQHIIGVLGVYEDISLRKQAEKELAESLSMLQATFEATADGILVLDLQGQCRASNRKFLQMWGLSEALESDSIGLALPSVLGRLAEPTLFAERIEELSAHPEMESFDLLTLNDGQRLECYSRPQRISDSIIGRVWSFRDITIRQRVEEQLLWRTTFLESLMESAPDGIIAVDAAGKKILQNHRIAELWQIPPEIAENPDDSVQVAFVKNQTLDPQGFVDKVSHLYANPEKTVHDEIELRHGVILERYSAAVHDRYGKYHGRLWYFTDVTEQRRAERALRQKEYYQRALMDNFPFLVWLKNAESYYLAVNKVYAEKLGIGTHDIIGKSDYDLFSKEVAEKYRADDREIMLSGQQKNLEEEVLEHGTRKWLETYKAPLIDEQGAVLGTVGFARDITSRKIAEQRLQLAALVYQNSSEAMIVVDADNKIITVNPAFSSITGYDAEEVAGQDPRILASGLHNKDFYRAMWHDLNTSGRWRGEIKNRRKSGELYVEELTINTIYDSQGQPQQRVALFSDITARKQSEEQIWLQANFDPLTALPNRRMFRDRLAQEIKKAHRMEQRFALLFIDLDRFKEVNDTLGHDVGDVLLKDAAERLLACVRESDTVARLGGDEFTIILREMDSLESPERVVKALLQKMSEPFHLGDELAYVSASIGITLYPDDARELGQLLKNADQAMYAAKSQGRNCYCFFTASMQETLRLRAGMLNSLRTALADHQFVICYQPIVHLATGSVNKAEALLRWRHPQRGLVNPAEFIALAEESGLIDGIGDWVFKAAARRLQEWRLSIAPEFQLSINMSPVQFRNPHYDARDWQAYLADLGLPGSSIVLEITEGVLLEASKVVTEQLRIFRDAGIQLAIDDFGTGYSALSYLKKFHIDFLKIDRAFVSHLSRGTEDFVLCEAIIVMAHKLGLQVIAEGVETEQQRALLAEIGCDYAQGYLYAQPLPTEEFQQRYRSQGG